MKNMVDWTKESDWLPMSNAIAQVMFWKDDLKKAEKFLDVLEGMGVSATNGMWKIANEDIQVSKRGLLAAQEKLYRTFKRVTGKDYNQS